ncbi:PQQ-binding-like beta-propeller repeat protein [Candidatus Riflebacteria bacterium]
MYFLLIPVLLAPVAAWIITAIVTVITFLAGLLGVKLKKRGMHAVVEFILNPRFLFCLSVISGILTVYLWVFRFQRGTGQLIASTFQKKINAEEAVILNNANVFGKPPAFNDLSFVWKSCRDNFFRTPTVHELVWLSGDRGVVYGVDRYDGKIKFEFSIQSFREGARVLPIYAELLVDVSGIYVGEGEHHHNSAVFRKFAFKEKKGLSLAWEFSTKGHIEGSPVIIGENIIFGAGGDGIYSLNKHTGQKRWFLAEKEIGHLDNKIQTVAENILLATGMTTGFQKRFPQAKAYFAGISAASGTVNFKIPISSSWAGVTVIASKSLAIVSVGMAAKYGHLTIPPDLVLTKGLLITDLEGKVKNKISTDFAITNENFSSGKHLYYYQEDITHVWDVFKYHLGQSAMPGAKANKSALYRIPLTELLQPGITGEKVFSHPQLLSGRGIVCRNVLLHVLKGGILIGFDLQQKKKIFAYDISESELDWLFSSPVIRGDRLYIANSAFKANWFGESLLCFKLVTR